MRCFPWGLTFYLGANAISPRAAFASSYFTSFLTGRCWFLVAFIVARVWFGLVWRKKCRVASHFLWFSERKQNCFAASQLPVSGGVPLSLGVLPSGGADERGSEGGDRGHLFHVSLSANAAVQLRSSREETTVDSRTSLPLPSPLSRRGVPISTPTRRAEGLRDPLSKSGCLPKLPLPVEGWLCSVALLSQRAGEGKLNGKEPGTCPSWIAWPPLLSPPPLLPRLVTADGVLTARSTRVLTSLLRLAVASGSGSLGFCHVRCHVLLSEPLAHPAETIKHPSRDQQDTLHPAPRLGES